MQHEIMGEKGQSPCRMQLMGGAMGPGLRRGHGFET